MDFYVFKTYVTGYDILLQNSSENIKNLKVVLSIYIAF